MIIVHPEMTYPGNLTGSYLAWWITCRINPEEISATLVVETLPDLIMRHPETQFDTHLRVRGTSFISVHNNRYLQTCFETKTRPEKMKIKSNSLRDGTCNDC